MNSELARVHIFVSGRVQGVFFRQNTFQKAKELGLTGWVRNLADGRVEIVAEGEKGKAEELAEWAKKGPLLAKVERAEIERRDYQGEIDGFEIRYD